MKGVLNGAVGAGYGVAALLLVLSGCVSVPPVDPVQVGGYEVYRARLYERPLPLLSQRYSLTEQQAYRIQRLAVEQSLRGSQPAGFKAGLTTPPSRAAFGIDQSVAGVLWPGSEISAREDGYHVQQSRFDKGLVEMELGFRLSEPVSKPVADVESLRKLVVEVVPVIELPDPGKLAPGELKAVDLIVNNVVAAAFIAGPGRAPALIEPDSVGAVLFREGEPVATGSASATWEALLWLVNRTVASGWTIHPLDLLITGPLAPPTALVPGLHVADFGELGRLEMWVE